MALINFDASKVSPLGVFDPLPAGDYVVQITDGDMVKASTGGTLIKLTFTVMSGPYKNRKIFENLSVKHDNKTTEEISLRALSAICRAINNVHPKVVEDLFNIPFVVRVSIKSATGTFPACNNCRGYRALEEGEL